MSIFQVNDLSKSILYLLSHLIATVISIFICNLASKSASGTNWKVGSGFQKYSSSFQIKMSTHIKVTKDTEIKINESIMFLETVLRKDSLIIDFKKNVLSII